MGGQSTQKNKPHKAGKHASKGSRKKHRGESAGKRAAQRKNLHEQSKLARLSQAQQRREKSRQAKLQQKREQEAPLVVAVLPLTEEVDVQRFWNLLLQTAEASCGAGPAGGEARMEEEAAEQPLVAKTVRIHMARKLRLTVLPPPAELANPLAIVDLAKTAELVLLLMPGAAQSESVDVQGQMALAVLRSMGAPSVLGVVAGAASDSLKDRSAARSRCLKAVQSELASVEKVVSADTAGDMQQVLRHVAEHSSSVPVWRQQRPAVMMEQAEFEGPAAEASAGTGPGMGMLRLIGYVRGQALSVNQLVTVPGLGDFQLASISSAEEPVPLKAAHNGMDTAGCGLQLLCKPDEQQDELVQENVPDPLAGEQTWPTEEELQEAGRQQTKRRLPAGTSDYQAAWILDDDDDVQDEEDEEDEELGGGVSESAMQEDDGEPPELEAIPDDDEMTMTVGEPEPEQEVTMQELEQRIEEQREMRQAAQEDAKYPDEVDVPLDGVARTRFQKYRGLKSFRTSPWDPRESLPPEYGRVFAFQNWRATWKRAQKAAAQPSEGQPTAIATGSYVCLALRNVPAEGAARVVEQVARFRTSAGAPCVAFGLLQHESKLSMMNVGLRKASGYEQPIRNKEALLMVTGVRSFSASPILSIDAHNADKFKMERFLQPDAHCVGSFYAPISYPPLPLLAFKCAPGAPPQLAAVGTVRPADPDRIVLKKIVLTGYPVRTHKRKAIVRYMFHNPEDIRWFKPCELWTKYGRRGRIKEPVGTHGSMKCFFDAPVQQRDTVCLSLYKRVFPKWPESMTFN